MAKTKGGQRARRQARQAKRARAAEQRAAQGISESSTKDRSSNSAIQSTSKAQAPKKDKSDAKPGIVKRFRIYLHDVRVELRRVVWPSPRELRNYTFAVLALLIVFGVAVWLVDTGVVAALVGYSGLRG